MVSQDIRSCVEQLQTIEKEVLSLETSQKELADLKDQLDDKKIERSELKMKQDVRPHNFLSKLY
jgi:kinetochore protein Nuf2